MFLPALHREISQGDVFTDVTIEESFENPPRQQGRVILLTNDCDIDKKNHPTVHVLRLIPVSDIPATSSSILGDIRGDRSPAALLIPAIGALPESFMDFRRIHRILKAELFRAGEEGRRILSMSEDGRTAMFHRIYTYFRRKQQPKLNSRDRAPVVQVVTPDTDRSDS